MVNDDRFVSSRPLQKIQVLFMQGLKYGSWSRSVDNVRNQHEAQVEKKNVKPKPVEEKNINAVVAGDGLLIFSQSARSRLHHLWRSNHEPINRRLCRC